MVWRVVDAHRASPLEFAIQAFPRRYATNIDQRAEIVASETAHGLAVLQARAERPPYFTNRVVGTALRIFQRVTNGIDLFEADFGSDLPPTRITPSVGRNGARNIDAILNKPDRPHQEVGSIEGYFQAVERGGHNRRVVHVIERITGDSVRCVAMDSAARELERMEIREIWRYRRVEVSGRIHFGANGQIDHIDADKFRFLRDRASLPQIDDVLDPDFTGGIPAEEYLEKLRDGTLS